MVTITWDTLLKKEYQTEGLEIVRTIWNDMKQFRGYIKHEILIDADNSGHIFIVSCWTNRELADQAVVDYANSDSVRLISPLLDRARKRTVFYGDI